MSLDLLLNFGELVSFVRDAIHRVCTIVICHLWWLRQLLITTRRGGVTPIGVNLT